MTTVSLSRALLTPFLRTHARTRHTQLNWLTVNVVLLSLIAVLAVGYILVTTNVATRGFDLKDLEQRVETLRDSHAQLTLEAAELQSITNLEAQADALELTQVGTVEYLSPEGAIARSQ